MQMQLTQAINQRGYTDEHTVDSVVSFHGTMFGRVKHSRHGKFRATHNTLLRIKELFDVYPTACEDINTRVIEIPCVCRECNCTRLLFPMVSCAPCVTDAVLFLVTYRRLAIIRGAQKNMLLTHVLLTDIARLIMCYYARAMTILTIGDIKRADII